MITDEMVRKAMDVAQFQSTTYLQFRAALEAVAPMILAPLQAENRTLRNYAVVADQALWDVRTAEINRLREKYELAVIERERMREALESIIEKAYAAIRSLPPREPARAQELDPK